MRECFSNLREYAGEAEKHFLVRGLNEIITIDKLPALAGKAVCNVILSKDSKHPEGFKSPSLFHHNPANGSLAIPNLVVHNENIDITAGVDGVDFKSIYKEDLIIPNETIGHKNNLVDIVHSEGGEISIGGSNYQAVDDNGVVDGFSIHSIGGGIKFPQWDKFFEVDTYLENADYPCKDNTHGLPSNRACETCEDRARNHELAEQKRLSDCRAHMTSLCTEDCTSDPIGYSIDFNISYENLVLAVDTDPIDGGLEIMYNDPSFNVVDVGPLDISDFQTEYPECYSQPDIAEELAGLINDSFASRSNFPYTAEARGDNFYKYIWFGRLNPFDPSDSYPEIPDGYVGLFASVDSDYRLCESSDYDPNISCYYTYCQDPGDYGLGQGVYVTFNQDWETTQAPASNCYDYLKNSEAYDECLQSCKDGSSSPITRHWRKTSRGMGCENPNSVKVDAAYECFCGGDYITADKNEDHECGWRALMNA